MMMNLRFVVFFFLSLSCLSFAQVQSNNSKYRFAHIGSENGLSHGSIKCFFKDHRGLIWIGTSNGLNRYDGNYVKSYTVKMGDFHAFNSNDIVEIFEDPLKNIWIKTTWGINIFDTKTERFSNDQFKVLEKLGIPNFPVEKIVKDRGGNFWFIYNGQGVTQYNVKTQKRVHLKGSTKKGAIISNHVSNIVQDLEGGLWLIHKNGILEKLNGSSLRVVYRNHTIAKQLGNRTSQFNLVVDRENNLWIGTDGDLGIFCYQASNQTVQNIKKGVKPTHPNNDFLRGMAEGPDGKIWITTENDGICLINKKDFSTSYINHNGELENSLSHNSILSLYKDSDGIIWIGTFKSGVDYYHKDIFKFPYPQQKKYSDSNSLSTNDVAPFAEDEKGNLWIGTNGGGLLYFNRSTGRYTKYQHDPNNANSICGDVIVSLLYDKNNHHLWIGTYEMGLDKFDGKKFTHYTHDPHNPHSLSGNSIYKLFEDSVGRLWVGTLQNGLDLFDRKTDKFYNSKSQSGSYPVHSNYICEIIEDNHGNIWTGGGYGIDVFNPNTRQSKHFLNDINNSNTLNSNNVLTIFKDSSGRIWVGTGEGLNFYNEKDNNFRRITSKDGLPGKAIVSIEEDNNRNLWLASSNSLTQFLHTDLWIKANKVAPILRNYDKSDGLQEGVFSTNSSLKLSSGELVFGGTSGFNIFNPQGLEIDSSPPAVLITGFELFNKPIALNEKINGRILLGQPISKTESLTLRYAENVFSITFTALNYIQPKKTKFKYKLEGFDQEWNLTTNANRRITYTNLNPGDYKLKILACNNNGSWTPVPKTLNITVLPPFYRTSVAYILYILIVSSLLYFTRSTILRRQKEKFILEQERREAKYLHNLDLMKIRFLTNISHEFRTPLALILAPIEKLLKDAEGNGEKHKQFQMIYKNAKRLMSMVDQLLDFRKIELHTVDLSLSEGDVIKFIKESAYSFKELAEKNNISLDFETNINNFHASFDMDKLQKILFNLLSNAFKFTPENGHVAIYVRVYQEDNSLPEYHTLTIEVKDSGIGIAEEKKDLIFERFYRNEVPAQMLNQGSGIGLSIVKEFVRIHGGSVTVESELGKGSCFVVNIPLKGMAQYVCSSITEEAHLDIVNKIVEEKKEDLYTHEIGKAKILIIEDNEDFLYYLKDNLGSHFTVIEAVNGREGWQKTLSEHPDLIISDLMMPVMNGIELCKKIRSDARTTHIPFILLTAYSSEGLKLEGLDIGISDYVTKPFSFEQLLLRIKNLIKQRISFQEIYAKKISVTTSEIDITSADAKFIQDATKIVEENIGNADFSVEELASKLSVSRTVLYLKMVELTESSPLEFIRNIRLERGAQLLRHSQLSIAEIAYRTGFNHPKYFSKYFKELYKMLPSEYKKIETI